jgi:hypothetical protein
MRACSLRRRSAPPSVITAVTSRRCCRCRRRLPPPPPLPQLLVLGVFFCWFVVVVVGWPCHLLARTFSLPAPACAGSVARAARAAAAAATRGGRAGASRTPLYWTTPAGRHAVVVVDVVVVEEAISSFEIDERPLRHRPDVQQPPGSRRGEGLAQRRGRGIRAPRAESPHLIPPPADAAATSALAPLARRGGGGGGDR